MFSQQDVTLDLYPEGPCSLISDTLLLHLSVRQSCQPGFSLENSSVSCVCDQTLQKYTNHCNITNGLGQITRESDDTFWVGYDESWRYIHTALLNTVSPVQLSCLSTVYYQTNSVHTTGQVSCVELVRKVIVWYWEHLTAEIVPTAISPCLFLLL